MRLVSVLLCHCCVLMAKWFTLQSPLQASPTAPTRHSRGEWAGLSPHTVTYAYIIAKREKQQQLNCLCLRTSCLSTPVSVSQEQHVSCQSPIFHNCGWKWFREDNDSSKETRMREVSLLYILYVCNYLPARTKTWRPLLFVEWIWGCGFQTGPPQPKSTSSRFFKPLWD